MQLTSDSLTAYLQERGLLTAREIVDGELMVIDQTRRNRNFQLRCREGGKGLFIKQVGSTDPQSVTIHQREAACYWLAAEEPAMGDLHELVPKFRCYDPAEHILVTDLIPQAEALTEFHSRNGDYPESVGHEIARLLTITHTRVDLHAAHRRLGQLMPGLPPWGTRLHREPHMLRTYGPQGMQLFGRLQQNTGAMQVLESLRASWQPQALTHGDIKLDNFLRRDGEGERRMYVIDWELADAGDPLWDVGSVFQAYLSYWIIFIVGQGIEETKAQRTLIQMQPLLQSFWDSYAAGCGLESRDAPSAFNRSVVFAGARLIQTAFESAASQGSQFGDHLLNLGVYLMTQPQEAALALLGFSR